MLEKSNWALNKCMAICSRSEKCVSDIMKKLGQWEIEPSESLIIIERLKEERFIDEERFTKHYVHDKLLLNQWGKIKISYLLKGKGIAKPVIHKAFEGINEETYQDILQNLLAQKSRQVKSKTDYEKKANLTRYALSRGFEYELIAKTLSSISL
jgi:regulatory protein